MRKIDAHVHFAGNHADCVNLLEELEIELLNICVAYTGEDWSRDKENFRSLAKEHPAMYAWCTTFDPPDYSVPEGDYAERVVADLTEDFKSGAVGCKIWKNVGMEVKKPNGDFLMVDDPVFHPIFEFLEKAARPVVMHIGEPLACWKPLDERSPHYRYYKDHPQWHMYGKEGFPSHEQLIAARDRVLEAHPKIRFVGAHLGSLEYDVNEIAKRLDRYPNFAVDSSARMLDLMIQPNAEVAAFLAKYCDRVLYGSDFVDYRDQAALPPEERKSAIEAISRVYANELDYLTSGRKIEYRGHLLSGLGLPDTLTRKLLFDNARAWYGI